MFCCDYCDAYVDEEFEKSEGASFDLAPESDEAWSRFLAALDRVPYRCRAPQRPQTTGAPLEAERP